VFEVVQECADQRCVQVGEVQPGRLFPGVLAREGDRSFRLSPTSKTADEPEAAPCG
jgi:hypothetical protein